MTNERLQLKPVREWNEWIASAFVQGPCHCIRCIDNEFNEAAYTQKHTHFINGLTYHRLFADTSMSDLERMFKAAYISFYGLKDESLKKFTTEFVMHELTIDHVKSITLLENLTKILILLNTLLDRKEYMHEASN